MQARMAKAVNSMADREIAAVSRDENKTMFRLLRIETESKRSCLASRGQNRVRKLRTENIGASLHLSGTERVDAGADCKELLEKKIRRGLRPRLRPLVRQHVIEAAVGPLP